MSYSKSSIWLYKIHGWSAEIIEIVEESKADDKNDELKEKLFKQSIINFQKDVAAYFYSLIDHDSEKYESNEYYAIVSIFIIFFFPRKFWKYLHF